MAEVRRGTSGLTTTPPQLLERKLTVRIGFAERGVIQGRAAGKQFEAGGAAELADAHSADRDDRPQHVECIEEARQIGRGVNTCGELENIGADGCCTVREIPEVAQRRCAAEVVHGDDALQPQPLGFCEDEREGASGAQLDVNEGGVREESQQQITALRGREIVAPAFRGMSRRHDQWSPQAGNHLLGSCDFLAQCVEPQFEKVG